MRKLLKSYWGLASVFGMMPNYEEPTLVAPSPFWKLRTLKLKVYAKRKKKLRQQRRSRKNNHRK